MNTQLAICFAFAVSAASAANLKPTVTVYAKGESMIPLAVEQGAWAYLTRVLDKAGIRLIWKFRDVPADPGETFAVRITFVTDVPAGLKRGALAFAKPFGQGVPEITVIYSRIDYFTSGIPRLLPAVLGHTLAHEIGHVLAGTDRHDDEGVMKARWVPQDYALMFRGALSFTPLHLDLMQERLQIAARRREVAAAAKSGVDFMPR